MKTQDAAFVKAWAIFGHLSVAMCHRIFERKRVDLCGGV